MKELIGLSRKSKLSKLIKPPSPSLNYKDRYLRNLVSKAKTSGEIIVDVGSGGRRLALNSINLDIDLFGYVNIVGDACHIPLKNQSVNLVILSAVLEHIREPTLVVNEIQRILKKNGAVYVENPFMQPFHADPNDFQRYTLYGLSNLFNNFKVIESGVCVGPFSAIAFFVRKFSTVFFTNASAAKATEFTVGWLTFWIKYFDWIFKKVSKIHIVASGIFLLLKKENAK